MSAERGAGVNTLAAYSRDLLDFAGHPKKGLAGASRDEVKTYLQAACRHPASRHPPRRASCRPCASSMAFSFAEEMRPDNPTEAVDSPRAVAAAAENPFRRRHDGDDRGGGGRSGQRRRASACWRSSRCCMRRVCGSASWRACRWRACRARKALSWCAARAARKGWRHSIRAPGPQSSPISI